MRRILVFVAAFAILAAATVALAPASLVGVAVERASAGVATLAGAEGTVWIGRGTLAARGGLRLPLRWTIDPWPLLHGTLRVQVDPAGSGVTPRATLEFERNGFVATGLDVALPAASVRAVAPKLGVTLDGDLEVVAVTIGRNAEGWNGGAKVEWRNARIAAGEGLAIDAGNLTAALDAASGRLAGPVTNTGGDVAVRGSVAIAANGTPEAALALAPRRDDPALARALSVARLAGGPLRIDVQPR